MATRVSRRTKISRAIVAAAGHRTLAHPWVFTIGADVAVMVSGNAMAHLYLDVRSRARTSVELDARWRALADLLIERPSVDLLLTRQGRGVHVRTASRGLAGSGSRTAAITTAASRAIRSASAPISPA